MKKRLALLLLPLVSFWLPMAAGASSSAAIQPAAATQDAGEIKGLIDGSVRWLRKNQRGGDGAYGDGVEGTSAVLHALAICHRKYQRKDGPFVALALDYLLGQQAQDGSIAPQEASDERKIELTGRAVRTLFHYQDADTRAVFGKALAYLGAQGVSDPFAGDKKFTDNVIEARKRAAQLIAKRKQQGQWEGERGSLLATSAAIIELSHYYTLLKPATEARPTRGLPDFSEGNRAAADAAILRGARFLIKVADNGLWGRPGQPDAGMTAMVLASLQTVATPRPADVQSVIDKGLAWLVTKQHEDGSIHDGMLASYVTSASILALARAGDTYLDEVIKAADFLIRLQANEGEGYSPDHHYYGGIGYGGDERPDLSNLQMALEALNARGLDPEHEAFQNALKFLERCQNRSESNDTRLDDNGVILVSGNDGGSGYMPGNSPAGYIELADGRKVPRSYGSMTYSLLKGFIFAGVEKEDPRMQACWEWLRTHYTLDVNPGFEHAADRSAAYQGLFYYFHVMAKALDLYGEDIIVDAQGVEHNWRRQMVGRLCAMQSNADGSWVNENAPRWWEGNPLLATSYALLTMEAARPAK